MDQRIIDLYDEYTHKPLPRRVFLERLTVLVGGAAAVPAVLRVIEPNYAMAAMVAEDDPAITAGMIDHPGGAGTLRGYLARPAGGGRSPAVIVIHENRGLNPHIRDVARRFARDGFLALAPDLLTPLGGTPDDPDRARDLIGQLQRDAVVADLRAMTAFLEGHDGGNGKVGAVGFCWGGGMVNQLAVAEPGLDAGVVYYGPSPEPAQAASIKAPLLLHYAGLDERINAGVPAYETALKAAGVDHTLHMYEGVNHAFNNDTSAERYDEAAATLAWQRTVAFLKDRLAAG
ncbi:dienelactone hydrolase family protein [Azospirillum halopraeferens]|uniref:dienelactone hydrolase family protein n=1 Tax=Azospirillum halopraeferens TaxID=34010 RepID=UPI0003F4E474|nr:dienelactone hydrolase family protein [Azospirillum halopraeferens]